MTNITQSIQSALAIAHGMKLSSPNKVAGNEGRRIGRGTGNALEFAEYRDYQPGDDIRRLAWSVYARTEQLMVKQFNEEVDPRCDLVIDQSASMAFPEEKGNCAMALAAILATAADNAGFTLRVWHALEQWKQEESPAMPLEWQDLECNSPVSPEQSIDSFHGTWQKRGIRILISDLLWPSSPEQFLRLLCDGARRTVILKIDFTQPFLENEMGNVTLIDSETGEKREALVDSDSISRFNLRLNQHNELWQKAAEKSGVEIISFTHTDSSPEKLASILAKQGIIQY